MELSDKIMSYDQQNRNEYNNINIWYSVHRNIHLESNQVIPHKYNRVKKVLWLFYYHQFATVIVVLTSHKN